MRRLLLFAVGLLSLQSCGRPEPPATTTPAAPSSDVTASIRATLVAAAAIEVLSLDPSSGEHARDPSSFHGWPIVGRIVLSTPAEVDAVAAAVAADLSGRDRSATAACEVRPRHGIRVAGASPLDLVICFECHVVDAFTGGSDAGLGSYRISGASLGALDAALVGALAP